MPAIVTSVSSVLLSLSFAGTKLLGPEKTSELFHLLGKVRQRRPYRNLRSLDEIEERIERGLKRLPIPVECLDQAMVAWHQLNLNGYPATLKIGMKLSPMMGHAWVVVGERVFIPVPGLEDYAVVGEFPPWS